MSENVILYDSILISLKVSIVSIVITFIIGSFLTFLSTFYRSRLTKSIELLAMLPLVLPPTVLGFYLLVLFGANGFLGRILFQIFDLRLTFSLFANIIASSLVGLPLFYKTFLVSVRGLDRKIIHNSLLLGHSKIETFIIIIIPLCKRGLFAGLVLAFIRGLGEFGASLMFAGNIPGRTTTMPMQIYNLSMNSQETSATLLAVILSLFSLSALLLSNHLLERKPNA